MKATNIYLICVLLCFSTLAQAGENGAQFLQKGNRLIGGSFTFSSAGNSYYENSDGDRTQEWVVRPGGGYFVVDNLALDLHVEGRWFIQGDVRSSHYAMGPVLQYYFDTVGEDEPKGHAVPYLGLGYLWGLAREDRPDSEEKFTSGMWSMSAGLTWMLSDLIGMDLEFNYQTGEFTEKIPVDGVARDANRISFFVGVKAFLP